MVSHSRSGLALLLVVLVSFALLALAVPFALAMRNHERSARHTHDRARARFAASAARNRAIAGTLPGAECREEARGAVNPFRTPFADGLDEFPAAKVPRATLGSAEGTAFLEDEQGKINTRTAPPHVVANLLKRVDPRVNDLRSFLTEQSGRPAAWAWPQTIRGTVPGIGKAIKLQVQDRSQYPPGSRVRVAGPRGTAFGTVLPHDDNDSALSVNGVSAVAVRGAILEGEVRHPVNLLTAPRAVIAACLEGLTLHEHEVVSALEADRLAEGIEKSRFRSLDELEEWLVNRAQARVISEQDSAAIYVNATRPQCVGATGTMPFTFAAAGFLGVDARGVEDVGTGGAASVVEIREVVECAPAGALVWRTRSQVDFLASLDLGWVNGMFIGPEFDRRAASPDRSRPAWFTAASAIDRRGGWGFSVNYSWTNDGQEVGDGQQFQVPDAFRVPSTNMVTWRPGAVELWFRAKSSNFTILEAGTTEWSDRLVLSYEGAGSGGGSFLRLGVKDGSLEKGWTQVTHPVTLLPGRWYHAGISYESTLPGGLMLRLDGMPVGRYAAETASGQVRHVHLAAAVDASATELTSLEPVDGFPVTGVLRIGSEAVEYASRTGTRFMGCRRGARGTSPDAHPAEASATWWGYAARLGTATLTYTFGNIEYPPVTWGRLSTGSGELAGGDFGSFEETVTVLGGAAADPPAPAFLRGESVLAVPAEAAKPFPQRGYLLVGTVNPEIVHYDKRSDSAFQNLTRGGFGTTERDHVRGESVSLYGFHVTTHDDYPSPTVLCIDGEFFGPVQKAGTDGWIGMIGTSAAGAVPLPLLRGEVWLPGLPPRSHDDGARVLPTFALPDLRADRGDRITLAGEDPEVREERTIAAAVWLQQFASRPFALFSPLSRVEPAFLLVGLDDAVRHEYVPDGRFVRALRWPSGELPSVDAPGLRVGFSDIPGAPGVMAGEFDELRATAGWPARATLASAVDAGSVELRVTDLAFLNPLGGAVYVDDELVGYTGFDPATGGLLGVQRGWLGTAPRGHARGAPSAPAWAMVVTRLQAAAGAADAEFVLSPAGLDGEGYLLVDREVIGYTRTTGTGVVSPPGCNVRGAFGTVPASHAADALAYAIPFRYFDRFVPGSDDDDVHSWATARMATSASWSSIRWEEHCPVPSLDVRVQVRFNHSPRWDDFDLPRRGGLSIFDLNAAREWSLGPTLADSMEIRVGFDYLPGAWERGEWKEAPLVRWVDVEYEQPTTVHRHEER